MSSQPSTMDSIRSTAASATQSVADNLDPSKNQDSGTQNPNSKTASQDSSGDKSFKQQLDEAAYTYKPPGEEGAKKETLVEKVASYIPGMSSLLTSPPEQRPEGGMGEEERKPESSDSAFMPKRPENDLHVEEFLKEQYKSQSVADMPDVKEQK